MVKNDPLMAEPDRGLFRDRRRAESFGSVAELYDALRPSYPDDLIAWLGTNGRGSAADVGCGTGQVARLLVAAGWEVTGVEVDARMAAVARSHGIDVAVSRFEEWQPAERFDLIASGQAWHWIDPEEGYVHAAELLRPGGRLVLFWNSYRYDASTQDVIDGVLSRRAPGLLADSVPFGSTALDHVRLDAEMVRKSEQWFATPERRVFAHHRHQSVQEWLAEVRTHSPVAVLSDDIRAALLADLASSFAGIEGAGIHVSHESRVTSLVLR